MFHRPRHNHRLTEMLENNQQLIQQIIQLSQHMQLALNENRILRREIVELTRDINSILHDHINSQQRCLILQQELTTKTSRISQLENDIIRLQQKIASLDEQLDNSISRIQTIRPNHDFPTNNASASSSSSINAHNNH